MTQLYYGQVLRPMLAANIPDLGALGSLPFPLIASPKIDGVRALSYGGKFHSRSGKLIPNAYVQSWAGIFDDLDGELTVGETFQDSTSGIMSKGGSPKFTFWVFDLLSDGKFSSRWAGLCQRDYANIPHVKIVRQIWVDNAAQLLEAEETFLTQGFEGICLRHPDGLYKQGRSTLKQAALLKLKRFVDGEAVVIGFEELMINGNEQTSSPLGYAEHSSHQTGLIPAGILGAFKVKDLITGQVFSIGTGFTASQRKEFWKFRGESILGSVVKYKHFPHGRKDLPRHPVFLGFRAEGDMS